MGATMWYATAEIFADYLYKVVKGTVRTYKVLNDGRRQIGGFYLPGDIFGLEFADEYTLSSDAITSSSSAARSRHWRSGTPPSAASFMRSLRELRRAQERILLLTKRRAGTRREFPVGNG